MEYKFHVAIVGGGIAGLVLAIALSKCPEVEIHIYEAAHQYSEIGAGIGFWPRVWKIMRYLGLDRDLALVSAAHATEDDETDVQLFTLRKSDQPEGLDYYKIHGRGTAVMLHRADFQKTVLKNMPSSCTTHFAKRLVALEEPSNLDEPVVLHFQDGSTVSCDVVFGADGIKSAVREAVFNNKINTAIAQGDLERAARLTEQAHPMWTGSVAYRAVIPTEVLLKRAPGFNLQSHRCPTIYCGKNKHLVVYAVSQGKGVNVVAFCSRPELEGTPFEGPMVAIVPQAELLAAFIDFEKDARDLLLCIENPSRWAIHAMRPLESYISDTGRVALIGDAAHAMTPHQGSGAGQAIEDAYILSSLLSHPECTRETLPEALRIYEEIRRPFSQGVLEDSRKGGLMYEFNWPGFTDRDIIRRSGTGEDPVDKEALSGLGKSLEELHTWVWSTTVDADRAHAVDMFQEYVERKNA
ncbi:FAD/NAD(P)-binding domain-containing protein [Heliocybe sulcata]|uniref:FAD/NAD(P)-binding domain-containing protein n=1 Tax=Heliocybe sulcata TaxID=5364 RepID=A0A5C3N1T0_9AGAM|nr:FAD/NAD(P)-binding domain-containing protein [Heliocybe sulcata]